MIVINIHWQERPVLRGWEEVADLFELLGERGYIAGSYAAWMAADSDHITPNDVDIFATSPALADEIAMDIQRLRGVRPEFRDTHWSFIEDGKGHLGIQVIYPHPTWATFPADILEWFDLDVSRAVLVASDKVLADENIGRFSGKLLRISDALRSLKRVMKYHRREVDFADWELLKLFQAWDMLPDDDKDAIIETARQAAFPEDGVDPTDHTYTYDGDGYRFD